MVCIHLHSTLDVDMLRLFSKSFHPAFDFNPRPALHLRLLLSAILQSKDGVVVAFGLVCSTFITISRGSTYRHFFLPEGDSYGSKSVAASNVLAARILIGFLHVFLEHQNLNGFFKETGSKHMHIRLSTQSFHPRCILYSLNPWQDFPGYDVGNGKEGGVGAGTTIH